MKFNGSYVEMTASDRAAVSVMANRGINACKSRINLSKIQAELFNDVEVTSRDLIEYMSGYYLELGFIPVEVIEFIMDECRKGKIRYEY